MAISHTSCVAPCANGVENPGYATDGNPDTYASLNNNLGIGNTVEIVMGFSNTGAPGSMVVIPIKQSGSLLNAGLLSLVTVEVLDASGNVIIQKEGLGTLDIGVLDAAQETSAITLFTPPVGSYAVSGVRLKLKGALNIQTSVYVGDAFYVEPSGSGCGIRYATTYDSGGSGICIGCSVQNPSRAADTDFTNYAQINVVIGLAATRYLELGWPTAGKEGDFVGVIMGTGAGLLDVSLLGNITITLYDGNDAGQSVSASSLLSASVLSGGSQYSMVGFNATEPFTAVRITMSAVVDLFNSMRIYGALTYDPTPPVAAVSATPGNTICEGSGVTISATGGFAGYAWSSGQSTQNITVSDAGYYSVVCTDGAGCPFFSPPVRIHVIPKPAVPAVTADSLACLGGNVRLSLDHTNPSYRYQLYKIGHVVEGVDHTGTGTGMDLFSVPVFSPSAYRVQVTDTATGCRALSDADLNITVPDTPDRLSSELDRAKCWVKPGNRYVHFVQPGTTRILASINPYGNDLGEVEVTSYVSDAPIRVQACGTYQSWFRTSVLNRRWHIEPETQPASDVDVRLYFDLDDYNELAVDANLNTNPNDDIYAMSELVLSKYDGANEDGNFANNCGHGNTVLYQPQSDGHVSAHFGSFSPSGRYVEYAVPGFSEFWLHGNSNANMSPLPVQLVEFSAHCGGESIEISWTTASEINSAYFTVYRSTDGNLWEHVGTRTGAGNSNVPIQYTMTDTRPYTGISYYRLEQNDHDGKSEIFGPVSVDCSGSRPFVKVYPDPATEWITVSFFAPKDMHNLSLICYDMSGKICRSWQVSAQAGTNSLQIDCSSFPDGMYQLFVGLPGYHPLKFVVSHR